MTAGAPASTTTRVTADLVECTVEVLCFDEPGLQLIVRDVTSNVVVELPFAAIELYRSAATPDGARENIRLAVLTIPLPLARSKGFARWPA